jgi:hypothetical protein
VITWRPAAGQAGVTHPFTVRVADNGTPSLSATQSFKVAVTAVAKPQLGSLAISNSVFQMRVTGDSGPDYVVQVSTNLGALSSWTPVFTNTAPTLPFAWADATPLFPVRF